MSLTRREDILNQPFRQEKPTGDKAMEADHERERTMAKKTTRKADNTASDLGPVGGAATGAAAGNND
jgi:hypothetical protein